jgi:Ca-activated chloride channel homolog
MNNFLTNFHLIRPWYLTTLIPASLLIWFISRKQDSLRNWHGVIADHLLKHLTVGQPKKHSIRPWQLLAVGWGICIIALSGPTWEKEPSPFAEDQAALFIIVKAAPSMTADDIRPSRLERATHKIKDLLNLRQGALHGLIAFSGSAHMVMPLTRDDKIVEAFASELSPEIMPAEGDATSDAVSLANEQLTRSGRSGSILLITDEITAGQLKSIKDKHKSRKAPVHILAVASENPPGSAPALNRKLLKTASKAMGGTLEIVTPDDKDIKNIASDLEKSLETAAPEKGGQRWRDAGFWLVPLITFLTLVWFRRGWAVRYE